MDEEYSRIIGLIKSVETTSTKNETVFVNLSEIVSGKSISEQKPDYQNLMELVYGADPLRSERRQVQRQMPVSAPIYPTATIQEPPPSEEAQKPTEFVASVANAVAGAERGVIPAMQAAEKEIREIISRIPLQKHRIEVRHVNIKDLVLPSLSISDQVSELERIIEGLRASAFDQDHLSVVAEEVYGLRQEVNRLVREMKKKQAEMNPLDKTLWTMREERLNDAVLLLKAQGAG